MGSNLLRKPGCCRRIWSIFVRSVVEVGYSEKEKLMPQLSGKSSCLWSLSGQMSHLTARNMVSQLLKGAQLSTYIYVQLAGFCESHSEMPISPWILQIESRYLSQLCDITRYKCSRCYRNWYDVMLLYSSGTVLSPTPRWLLPHMLRFGRQLLRKRCCQPNYQRNCVFSRARKKSWFIIIV